MSTIELFKCLNNLHAFNPTVNFCTVYMQLNSIFIVINLTPAAVSVQHCELTSTKDVAQIIDFFCAQHFIEKIDQSLFP